MNRLVYRLLDAIDTYALRPMPSRLVSRLRKRLWVLQGAKVGTRVTIGTGVKVVGKSGLTLKSGVSIARDVTLDARGGLTLADHALIGFESVLLTSTHCSDQVGVPIQDQGMFQRPCHVGERAWLGARVILQPGSTIGEDAIVGSGAVVTADIPPRSIAAGVPCRVIRAR